MPVSVFALESSGSRVYRLGRAGYDTGIKDVDPSTGTVFTGTLKTEKISPAGEAGLCWFRRVAFRIWRTGSFVATITVWVDGVQTKRYDSATSAWVDQVVSITKTAPDISPEETIIEAAIAAKGTYIEVQLVVDADDVTGVFLPESVEVHSIQLRPARSQSQAESI